MTTMQGNGASLGPGASVPPSRERGAEPLVGQAEPGLAPGQMALCPYCGNRQAVRGQCQRCKGLFEPLSRQATQNAMGPWFIRDEANPFRPGCSQEKLRELVAKGRVTRLTIIRGPSTRQFWTLACCAPGIAAQLGECHACHARVNPDEFMCRSCGVTLGWDSDRQYLGLAPVKLLPGAASASEVASSGMLGGELRPTSPMRRPPAASQADDDTTDLSEMELLSGTQTVLAPRRPGALQGIPGALLGASGLGGALAAVVLRAPSGAGGG